MTKVVIANRWTDPDGEVHKGGDVVDVRPALARLLLTRGKARPVEAEADAEKRDPGTADAAPAPAEAPAPAALDAADAAPAPAEAPAEVEPTTKPATRRGAKKEVAK